MKAFPLTLVFLISSLSAEARDPAKNEVADEIHKPCEECKDDKETKNWLHQGKGFLSITPRYMFNSNNRHHQVFRSEGFGQPNAGLPSVLVNFGRRYSCGLESGIVIGSGNQKRGGGSNQAAYDFIYGGLYFGYDLLKADKTDVIVSSSIAYGSTHLEVFSGNNGSRLTEKSFFAEPAVSINQRLSEKFSLGLQASYLFTFGRDEKTLGQNLNVDKIAPRGATAGLNLIFHMPDWKKHK